MYLLNQYLEHLVPNLNLEALKEQKANFEDVFYHYKHEEDKLIYSAICERIEELENSRSSELMVFMHI